MNKTLFLLLLITFAACSVNKNIPTWITNVPRDPSYFTVVVDVPLSSVDHKSIARDKAIRELAMQISTQVDASITVKETEKWGISNNEYYSMLQTSSSAYLAEFHPTATYQNAKTYYEYYRISKESYYAQRKIKRDQALVMAIDMIDKYDSSSTDKTNGINLLLSALDSISDFMDMDLSIQTSGKIVNVHNEITSRLRTLASQLYLSWDQTLQRIPAKHAQPVILHGSARIYDIDNSSVRQLPLAFFYEIGKGEIAAKAVTDDNGKFQINLNRVTSYEPIQSVSMCLDKDYFAKTISKLPTKRVWDSISFSKVFFRYEVVKPKVLLDYNFVSGYQSGLKEAITGHLANLNIDTTDKIDEAQYLLKVRIFPKQGEYISHMNYYTSYGDVHATLLDPLSGATINYLESLGIKSGGNSKENAERSIEKDGVQALADGLLYRLLYDTILK